MGQSRVLFEVYNKGLEVSAQEVREDLGFPKTPCTFMITTKGDLFLRLSYIVSKSFSYFKLNTNDYEVVVKTPRSK